VTKPFDPLALAHLIDEICARARGGEDRRARP
jgi:hypothetical protein